MNKEEIIKEPIMIDEKPEFKTLDEMKEELGNKFDEYMYKCNTEFLIQIYEMNKKNKQLRERIDKALDLIFIKCSRFINEKDYNLSSSDLWEIGEILKKGDSNE